MLDVFPARAFARNKKDLMPNRDPKVLVMSCLFTVGLAASCGGKASIEVDSGFASDGPATVNLDSDLAIDGPTGLTGDSGEAGSSETGGPEAGSEAGMWPGPGCPHDRPASGDTCSLPSDSECAYDDPPCSDGSVLKAIYWCTSGQWTSLRDLGCNLSLPVSSMCTGIAGQPGSCSPEGVLCDYVELCPGNEPLMGSCTCSGGSWNSCLRSYDCNPPSTCLMPSGDCVTTGSQNWSAGTGWCPSGTTMGACQGHPCRPGDARPLCGQTGSPSRSAVCVYGQWACGLGYSLLAR